MSIFGNIMGAIFGSKASAAPAAPQTPSASSPGGATSASVTTTHSVDVAEVLDKAVAEQTEKLEWRTSIVDLMKAIKLDSGLAARKELATELHYTGDMHDSAAMNVWLHKQVIQKLADNGGKVPAELKA